MRYVVSLCETLARGVVVLRAPRRATMTTPTTTTSTAARLKDAHCADGKQARVRPIACPPFAARTNEKLTTQI